MTNRGSKKVYQRRWGKHKNRTARGCIGCISCEKVNASGENVKDDNADEGDFVSCWEEANGAAC